VPTSVIDMIQALVIVFAVAGFAVIHLPQLRQFAARRLGGKKEGAV
jgi:simple sugar transport system permease protein